ncbi:MAG: alpha/beta hydrolase [Verrucomicrobiales bacterium]|nr:alpha/beta hydrolase [Verrucomicrobiales bacterium]
MQPFLTSTRSRIRSAPRALGVVVLSVLLPWFVLPARSAEAAPERIPLWSGTAPSGEGKPIAGNAYVTVYRPTQPNGASVIICPGGGYGGLVKDAEGSRIARWLNQHGITGIVLEYRLPGGNRFVPLLDAQRALRWARAQAPSWGCDPQRIGIMGFSAGGHLAATAITHFDRGDAQAPDVLERLSCRPDFGILVYPVVTMGDQTHGGSRQNLLGPNPSADVVVYYSNEKQVTAQTPPTYLAHARDDRAVPVSNSSLFYQALRQHGVPTRFLELPSGDHGLNGYQGPMWDAWQSGSLQWLAELKLIPEAPGRARGRGEAGRPSFPRYDDLRARGHSPQLLPGVGQFVFSLYGVPGDSAMVHQVVDVMRERKLGNGFDPGPGPSPQTRPILDFLAASGWPVVFYSGGEMQIKGGRGVFGPPEESAVAEFDRTGVFAAYQLGEWGYYFHNLSHRESWWRDVYGKDYDQFKHLQKPAGLAGYDRMPQSRKECYDVMKDYFASRSRDLLGRVISVTGHSHYEAYAGEWGARCIGLELGENIAFTQSKLAFARGAARQWGKPWSVQVSPWFGPSCTTSGPLRKEGDIVRGLDAGHSLSFYERMWLHAWFSGAAMVTPENSIAIFFEKPEAPWTFTEHGRKGAEVFQFMSSRARGIPYTPVAVVMDRYAGYNGYMDKPWGILTPTAGDREARDLFDHQLFPGSDHIHSKPDKTNPEASYLRPTPFGEVFDVLLTSVPPEILPAYPVILLVGDIEFEVGFLSELEKSLRRGSRVLISQRHRDVLGAGFDRLSKQGSVEVLEPWMNPTTGRPTAISNQRLASITQDYSPFELQGDPVQYGINRVPKGWVLEIINNRGVGKRGDQPASVDPQARARVTINTRVDCQQAKAWKSGQVFEKPGRVELELGPGALEYIEFLETPR